MPGSALSSPKGISQSVRSFLKVISCIPLLLKKEDGDLRKIQQMILKTYVSVAPVMTCISAESAALQPKTER